MLGALASKHGKACDATNAATTPPEKEDTCDEDESEVESEITPPRLACKRPAVAAAGIHAPGKAYKAHKIAPMPAKAKAPKALGATPAKAVDVADAKASVKAALAKAVAKTPKGKAAAKPVKGKAAPHSKDGRGDWNPSWCLEKSRKQALGRTGLFGKGQSVAFTYAAHGSMEKAIKAAERWVARAKRDGKV